MYPVLPLYCALAKLNMEHFYPCHYFLIILHNIHTLICLFHVYVKRDVSKFTCPSLKSGIHYNQNNVEK